MRHAVWLFALFTACETADPGLVGPEGPVGPMGLEGPQGTTGPVGAQGPAGPSGAQGIQGQIGPVGAAGSEGPIGPTGPTGPTGPMGLAGAAGAQGPQGARGIEGPMGPEGPQGADGAEGPEGPAGLDGAPGLEGPPGLDGAPGLEGPPGLDGAPGLEGPIGDPGPPGAVGPRGFGGAILVDRNDVVVGMATNHHSGVHVDANGNFWGVNRVTGEVFANADFGIAELFTSTDCTSGPFVAGTSPRVVMEWDGRYYAPPDDALPQPYIAGSQLHYDGSCSQWVWDGCVDSAACYAVATVESWPELQLPAPFDPPLHVEFTP